MPQHFMPVKINALKVCVEQTVLRQMNISFCIAPNYATLQLKLFDSLRSNNILILTLRQILNYRNSSIWIRTFQPNNQQNYYFFCNWTLLYNQKVLMTLNIQLHLIELLLLFHLMSCAVLILISIVCV